MVARGSRAAGRTRYRTTFAPGPTRRKDRTHIPDETHRQRLWSWAQTPSKHQHALFRDDVKVNFDARKFLGKDRLRFPHRPSVICVENWYFARFEVVFERICRFWGFNPKLIVARALQSQLAASDSIAGQISCVCSGL